LRDTFLKKGNNDEFIFLNSSRAIAQLVEQWIVKTTCLFFLQTSSSQHAKRNEINDDDDDDDDEIGSGIIRL